MFCYLAKFTCLITFNSWNIGQNVYCISVCFPGYDITYFEIDLIFLIKPFFGMIKTSRQKLNYPENKNKF